MTKARGILNISDDDYELFVGACLDARDRGDDDEAQQWNRLCRRANTALTKTKYADMRRATGGKGSVDFRAKGPLDV